MQALGDTEATLGLLFGTVGLGCFVGPIMMNLLVPPQPTPLLWGTVASFGFLLAGYLLMLIAPNISIVLVSTFVRSIGAASCAQSLPGCLTPALHPQALYLGSLDSPRHPTP